MYDNLYPSHYDLEECEKCGDSTRNDRYCDTCIADERVDWDD